MGAAIAIGATALGTGLKLKGISDQKKISIGQARFQARVAKNNAVRAEAAARDAIKRGQVDEATQRQATSQAISSSRASAAARGVDVDVGSAVDVAASIAQVGEQDALTIRQNAAREAFNIRQQGEDFTAQAEQAVIAGKNASRLANRQVAGTLIGGATSVASRWYKGGF